MKNKDFVNDSNAHGFHFVTTSFGYSPFRGNASLGAFRHIFRSIFIGYFGLGYGIAPQG